MFILKHKGAFVIFTVAVACQGNNLTLGRIARAGEGNHYYLYTRDTPRTGVRVNPTVAAVNLTRVWKPDTVIVIHDVKGNYLTGLNPTVKDALLTAEDVNVIVMDWRSVAKHDMQFVTLALPQVADGLKDFIQILVQTRKVSLDKLHLVGLGVGAHLAGITARSFTNVARITALDPSGNAGILRDGLRDSDALYVEVIHTDSGVSGTDLPLGQVDFYPSSGINQEGCADATDSSKCNHDRAWELFAASITHPGTLEGNKCADFEAPLPDNCKGYVMQMGGNDYVKFGAGTYYVAASDKYPYDSCVTACQQ
ncbi:lipase domain-containing protein [Phthorimaea operculella]|nr:lipase domain-containing protein [Phthorimaea operculella]